MVPVMTMKSSLRCPHGGSATGTPNPRVLVDGAPVLVVPAPMPVAGCPNMTGALTGGQHTVPASFCLHGIPAGNFSTRVTAHGAPLLLASSMVVGQPSGVPLVMVAAQGRVVAG